MNVLYIGRFQPYHNGHHRVIIELSKGYDTIIVGIGSSQYGYTRDNPFSADERMEMIKGSLGSAGVSNYRIVLIPDIHDPPRWVDHVLGIVSDFDVVVSNNPLTRELFSVKGYRVENTPFYDRHVLSGKGIRERIRSGKHWEDLVPDPVVDVIKRVKGEERIRSLY
ncbi:MAG: nicotinamide-nucleotide adenylyltransferase [Candidatus Thermoplasmatota archaeon]